MYTRSTLTYNVSVLFRVDYISDEQVVNIRQDTNNLDKSLEKKLDYSGT